MPNIPLQASTASSDRETATHRSCSYPLDRAPLPGVKKLTTSPVDPRFTMALLPDHQSSPVKGCSFSLIAFLTHHQPSTAGCDESVHVSGEVNRKNFAAPLRNDGKQTRYCPLQTRST
uniref:Uncharacterized protein n=1 Tax=Brassica campestris TaxID=3711 RepID=M4EL30_BRACM